MLCLYHDGPALLRVWFQTNHGRENSTSYLKRQAGKTFSYLGHALVTLYAQCLCSNWSKFDRWVHVENLCSVLKLVYFDSWSWQSFVSTCDVFNCLFPLDVQNEIQLLSSLLLIWSIWNNSFWTAVVDESEEWWSQAIGKKKPEKIRASTGFEPVTSAIILHSQVCYSWLVCSLFFWLRDASLVKVGNPISDGIVFVFHLAWCVLKRIQNSQAILALLDSFWELHLEW